MTDSEFIERKNNIDKECMLQLYKKSKEAWIEVDVFLIEKQKEQIKKNIKTQFENKMSVERPKITDNGRYVFPCTKGVSPFDIMRNE